MRSPGDLARPGACVDNSSARVCAAAKASPPHLLAQLHGRPEKNGSSIHHQRDGPGSQGWQRASADALLLAAGPTDVRVSFPCASSPTSRHATCASRRALPSASTSAGESTCRTDGQVLEQRSPGNNQATLPSRGARRNGPAHTSSSVSSNPPAGRGLSSRRRCGAAEWSCPLPDGPSRHPTSAGAMVDGKTLAGAISPKIVGTRPTLLECKAVGGGSRWWSQRDQHRACHRACPPRASCENCLVNLTRLTLASPFYPRR